MTKSRVFLSLCLNLLGALMLSGCGGGGGSAAGGGVSATPSDFTLSVQPSVVTLSAGTSGNMTVSVSGSNFSGTVTVTVSGLPSDVTASPAQFSLAAGAQQTVALSAAATAASASVNISVNGTSGSLGHSAKATVLINPAVKAARAPFRTGYIRTDVQWDASFLAFAPQRWIIYHAPTRRFFATDTFLNRVDVVDATTQQVIGQIPVPGAFVGDETPDHSAIYMGTQVGDIYKIDPVNLKVLQRFPAVEIGPGGFAAFEVRVLADGRLALLGAQGGIPAVDGFSSLAIWNPADNSFFIAPRSSGFALCPFPDHITEFTLTADRTKVLLGEGESGGGLCSYDPATEAQLVVVTNALGIGIENILTPADGQEIIVGSGSTVRVYAANGLFQTDQFEVGAPNANDFFYYSLSLDGNTLYAISKGGAGSLLAYNWRTHQLIGWTTGMDFLDLGVGSFPDAIDETGLVAAVAAHGISFMDAGALHPGAPTSIASNTFLSPSFGPAAGGTNVDFTFIATPPATSAVLFGNQLGPNLAPAGEGVTVTSPPGLPGPVDVTALLPDGNLVLAPEAFSYGPSIVELATDSTTAEGGGTGTIFGYGFGNARFGGQAGAGLQVLVNGHAATNLQYIPNPLDSTGIGPAYLFPMESLSFTFPPGSAGTRGDITVSNSAGSATAAQAMQYLPATRQVPLPGSVLVQGIYDSRRDAYYFSDATKVQVFSKASGSWLAPINMPAGATRLWGLSLSPDGSKLAVSDAGAAKIYVLNPDTPAAVSTFNSAAPIETATGGEPAGLAITDTGFAYYMVFYTDVTGPAGLHKLDTNTGVVKSFQSVPALALGDDSLTRVLLSNDNARLYVNTAALLLEFDTSTDVFFANPAIPSFDYDLTLASNQTWMHATGWLMDTNLNPQSFLTFTDRQGVSVEEIFGAKLSPDGSLLFQPLLEGIDVFDGKQGTLRTRIALPIQLSANYDALVADGQDNVLVAIAGVNGDGGVAVIDLSGLPVPAPLPFASATSVLPRVASLAASAKIRPEPAGLTSHPQVRRRLVNDVKGHTGLRVLYGSSQNLR
jgi:hypothetical protein